MLVEKKRTLSSPTCCVQQETLAAEIQSNELLHYLIYMLWAPRV